MKSIKWKIEIQQSGGTRSRWFDTKKEALQDMKFRSYGIQRLYKYDDRDSSVKLIKIKGS